MASSAKTFKVSAIVFKQPEKSDYQKLRHTALWFEPVGGGTTVFCNATGEQGAFAFEKRENYNPLNAAKYAGRVKVGTMRKAMTYLDLERKMRSVPCRNEDEEFNCQNWVDDAVKKLSQDGYLTNEEYEVSMSEMIDITMKAAMEDYGRST